MTKNKIKKGNKDTKKKSNTMGFVKHSLDVQKILIRTTKKNLQRKKKRGGKKDRMNSV